MGRKQETVKAVVHEAARSKAGPRRLVAATDLDLGVRKIAISNIDRLHLL